MKRHPTLVPLSRDHHHALAIARHLRRATERDSSEARRMFLTHWEEHERPHFRLEEEVLLPAYAVRGDPNHPAVVGVLVDHIMIRRDAARLDEACSLEVLHRLGARLGAHVELEERELFPLIEGALTEPELVELGERIREAAV